MGFFSKKKEQIPPRPTVEEKTEELGPLSELTELEKAKKQEHIRHMACLEISDKMKNNPDKSQLEQLKIQLGYAIIDWQEAQKEVKKLEDIEKLKKKK
jgi:hypothetical protein